MSDIEGDAVVSNPKKKLKTGTLCVETQTQVQEKKAAESQTEDIFPDQPLYKDEETIMNGGRISPKRKGRYEKKQLPDTQPETATPLPDNATLLPDNAKQKTENVAAHPDIDNAPSVEKDVQKDSIKETS